MIKWVGLIQEAEAVWLKVECTLELFFKGWIALKKIQQLYFHRYSLALNISLDAKALLRAVTRLEAPHLTLCCVPFPKSCNWWRFYIQASLFLSALPEWVSRPLHSTRPCLSQGPRADWLKGRHLLIWWQHSPPPPLSPTSPAPQDLGGRTTKGWVSTSPI